MIVLLCSVLMTLGAGGEIEWGVTGHPWAQEGYVQIPVEEQLDLVAELGARWYRSDWSQGSVEAHPEYYEALVDEAAKRGIRMLPILFPSTGATSDASPDGIEKAARAFGQAMAARFRGRVTHWELANERDSFALVKKGDKDRHGKEWPWGDPNGADPNEYEEGRYQKVKAEIVGFCEGIKSGDPDALTIVNSGGWMHYGFFERLIREDSVPFDILGWHWYSEMGDVTKVADGVNVYECLKRFGKPIWVTECDRRGGSMGGEPAGQAQYLAGEARRWTCGDEPMAQAFFAYELLDEPYFGPDNAESHYGLVEIRKGLDEQWRISALKDAFYALQAVFRGALSPGRPPEWPALRPIRTARGGQNPFGTHTTCLVEGHENGRIPAFLDDIATVGYGWVKDYVRGGEVIAGEDLEQKWAEFPPHYEEYLRAAKARNMRVLLRVDMPTVRRADGATAEPGTPETCAAVAQYCRTLVRSFKTLVKDWEIDNEPNSGNETPRVEPEDYVALVRAASVAIRAEDPEARVYAPASAMLQCLGDWPYPYIPKLIESGLLNDIDVFSFHPCHQPYATESVPEHGSEFHPWTRWGTYARQIGELRALLKNNSVKVIPIAATEVGWPTHRIKETDAQPITLTTQAKYEQRAMLLDLALGVSPRINFVFKRPWNDPYAVENQFNLVNMDDTKRPAFFAARNVCAVFGETPEKEDSIKLELMVSDAAKAEVHAFRGAVGGVSALLIAVWAGVPPEPSGRYGHGTARLTIHAGQFANPVLYDLMLPCPIQAIPLPSVTSEDTVVLPRVPVRDAPIVLCLCKQ